MKRFIPRSEQEQAIRFLESTPYAALWARMGSGKTVATLTVLARLLGSYGANHVLIVAPRRVAQHVWPQEIALWSHTAHLVPEITADDWAYTHTLELYRAEADGDALVAELAEKSANGAPDVCEAELIAAAQAKIKRCRKACQASALAAMKQITIISVDMLPRVADMLRHSWPFDTVVLDEASLYKSQDSKRHAAVAKLRRTGLIARLIELTGTPAGNGLLDVHGQIRLLDIEQTRLGTLTEFRQTWFDSDFMGYSHTPKPGALVEISDRLRGITLVLDGRTTAEPPRINDIHVYLDAKEMAKYQEMKKKALLEVEEVTAVNAAVVVNKLAQIASGVVYNDDGSAVQIHRRKYEAVADVVEEMQGDPLLIVYNYKSELAELRKMFPDLVELRDDKDTVENWNAGKIPVMALHPRSGGHGLNLQHGGATMLWFSLTWSLELYEQVIARLDRSGQTRQVLVHRLLASGTIDHEIAGRLAGKDITQQALIAEMKGNV